MDHQQYEEWVFDNKLLSLSEKLILNEHIAGCKRCQRLNRQWQEVETQLINVREVKPLPGFGDRFNQYQQKQLDLKYKKQALQSLIYLGLAILVIFTALSLWFFANISFGELIVSLVSIFSGALRTTSSIRNSTLLLLRNISPTVPFLVIVNIIGWAIIASIMWVLTLWKFARQGVTQHEK